VTGPKTNERPGIRASLRGAQMSAYKVREVLDLIRGREVAYAADILRYCERGPADAVGKILASAVANAAHNEELDPEELYVSACYADEGKTMRRMRPRARGRATRIRRRSSHITVIVSRLPEDRLARLRARRATEQASRRARRGGAGRAGDRARRVGRIGRDREATEASQGGATGASPAVATGAMPHEPVPGGVGDAELEAGVVDTTAAAVELNERGTDEAGAGARAAGGEQGEAEPSAAGIVDQDAAAVEAAERHGSHASGAATEDAHDEGSPSPFEDERAGGDAEEGSE